MKLYIKSNRTVETYKGYGIDYNCYGGNEYSVQYDGDDLIFNSIEDAHNFIDENSNDVKATTDTSYTHNLVKISNKDRDYVLTHLNKSHKTLGRYGVVGDPTYFESEFENGTPGFMWASDDGLKILDDNDIIYERVVKSSTEVTASKWYYYEPLSKEELNALKSEIYNIHGCSKVEFDESGMEELGQLIIMPFYEDIPVSDSNFYDLRKQLLRDVIRIAKKFGLTRTEDAIEDYGSCFYIVFKTNKPKTDRYDEF